VVIFLFGHDGTSRLRTTFCIAVSWGALETVCPAVMLIRNVIIKLSKCSLERVMPQTTAAMLLQLKLQCPAPNCGNALLGADLL